MNIKVAAKVNPRVNTLEKVPPQALEGEIAVLGSMLIEEDAISQVLETIDESFFYKEAHKIVFSSIIKLYTANKAVDLVTLTEELKKSGDLEKTGGAAYLTELTTAVPTAANVKYYANIVKEKAVLRNLITVATQIATDSYEATGDVDALIDKAERLIFEISSRKIEGGFHSLKDIIKDSIETIDSLYQRKGHLTGLATGFHDLDAITAGLQSEDFIVIAGRPSMGKSALVGCIAEHVGVVEKIPVGIFSLEMSREQLVRRMLCSYARVDAHKVRTGFLSQDDWNPLVSAAGKLSDAKIFIDDTPGISALELRAKARRLKSQHNIGLIIVDYLQLMQGLARSENRQQEISEISRFLKALARELRLPVIAVSQLSRAVEARVDHRPLLSDLRESGAIEQDADLVILLLREEYYYPNDDDKKGTAEAIIAKQRNGPVGSVKLTFIKEFARFEDFSPRHGEDD